jgi:hypothetical protein
LRISGSLKLSPVPCPLSPTLTDNLFSKPYLEFAG